MTMVLTPAEDTNAGLRTLVETASGDLLRGFRRRELWGRLGWLDVKRRYRRTTIGPFWTSITLAIYVLTVGTVGAAIWHQNIYDYLPFLVSGMIVWTLVSSIIIESCNLFITGQSLFRSIRFDYSILSYALVWRNFLVLLHNFVIYFLVVAGAETVAFQRHGAPCDTGSRARAFERRLGLFIVRNHLPAVS